MRARQIAMLVVAVLGGAVIACGGSSGRDATPEPTIDVSGLTPGVIADRALAALQREGYVTHIRAVVSSSAFPGTYDLWIDWNGVRARLDKDGFATKIVADGTQYTFLLDRVFDEPAEQFGPPEDQIVYAAWTPSSPLQYLRPLRNEFARQAEISTSDASGRAAIVVNITPDPTNRFLPPMRYGIFLDPSFLPLRFESENDDYPSAREVSELSTEFVAAGSIAAGFFDKNAAFGVGQTPIERLSFARDTGFTAYWLGTAFEGVTLTKVSGERVASGYSNGTRVVTVDYAVQQGRTAGLPCDAYLVSYPRSIWQQAVDARMNREGDDGRRPESEKELEGFDAPGGRAQIVEEHKIGILPGTPAAQGEATPTPLPPDVPPLRGDVADTVGRLTAKDYVVEAHLSCRASVDEKMEPLKRILAALRPYPE